MHHGWLAENDTVLFLGGGVGTVRLKGKSKCTPSYLLCLLGDQDNDLSAASQMLPKLIEKVITVHLQKYLEANQLIEPLQSAYKPFESSETALAHVHDDILVAIYKHHGVMLLLLDLSAAFYTVDHDILFTRLPSKYSISGIALEWFCSYLTDC